jgi:sterol desaturase/sphingolipid hydroxylase (fatty acid hydroxylase superfamily)
MSANAVNVDPNLPGTPTGRHLSWLAYPATMAGVLALHFALRSADQPLWLAAYLPVLAGAAAVTLLEWHLPNERAWWPGRGEVGQDLLYMAAIQLALPKLVGLALALAAAAQVEARGWGAAGPWPHEWPAWAQALSMLLIADFLRYWLHVAAHRVPFLWRFHAVHHSPERLYWLNVGRFHPVDKTLQLLLDTAPFVLLGVAPGVIALYFVFYAVNGFFQHCNVRLRLGWLNYLISGPELHRWHHSRVPRESNTNYGNNVIVWDLLFGTWFLPRDGRVGELGLINRRYPADFVRQMGAPLTPGASQRDVPLQRPAEVLRRWRLAPAMLAVRALRWWPLRRAARDPRAAQLRVLEAIVAANRDTRFGREHGFAEVRSYADFAARVPLSDYERLRPYVEAQEAGERALTAERPVMYSVTSGTTGKPKYIPVLPATLAQFRAEQELYTWVLYRHCPDAFAGRGLGLVGAAVEGRTASGLPYGSVSGYLYRAMPRLLRRGYVLPPEVNDLSDYELKYRVVLLLALAAPDISYMAGANPSSFLRLLDVLGASRELLAECLERGDAAALGELPPAVAAAVARGLRPLPERAGELRSLPRERALSYADLWPRLRLVTVWTGGSCGVAVPALKARLPAGAELVELGYLSSELRVTTTIDAATGAGAPTLRHHFFEFVERDAWERGERDFRLLDELQDGAEYHVVVTTPAGLYRYPMNDIVRVAGRLDRLPLLRFVQKGKGVTSITGEKLHEEQLLSAVAAAAAARGVTPLFVMALADEARARYRVYLEPAQPPADDGAALVAAIDGELGALNIEYRAKRASGRLGPLEFAWLGPGTLDALRRHSVARGQREGQFKTVALQYARDFAFPIDDHLVAPAAATR